MMAYSNFTNGALVMRVWRFDGNTELIAKFQYYSDAKAFASMAVARDLGRNANGEDRWFYLAVCENECEAQAFFEPKKPETA